MTRHVRRPVALHPLLLAAAPVLFLWSQNAQEVGFTADVLLPLVLTVVAAALLYAVLAIALRDHRRGALAASGVAVIALTFGYAVDALEVPAPALLAIAGGLTVGTVAVGAFVGWLEELTRLLNGLGAILVVVAAVPGFLTLLSGGSAQARLPGVVEDVNTDRSTTRDIYYLVFDRYARADTLDEEFDYDNSPFLDFLRGNGFVVAEQSLANYPKTAHSVATSLNLQYVQDLVDTEAVPEDAWGPVYDLMQDHAVGRFLSDQGYRYIHVGNWFDPLESSPIADEVIAYDRDSEFTDVYEQTTVWPTLREQLGLDGSRNVREVRRNSTEYQLDALDELASRTRNDVPEFVFAEVTLPHGPYAFDAQGNFLSEDLVDSRSRRENYLDHLEYANRRIRALVAALLSGPAQSDPVIVLQADEGPNPERMEQSPGDIPDFDWTEASDDELETKLRILNAYHLPDTDGSSVYPTITPVNSFRVVLDTYFGTDLGLLDDHIYVFTDEQHLYDFTEVTDRVR